MQQASRLRRLLALVAGVAVMAPMTLTGSGVSWAATTDPDPSPREIAHAALSRQAATEGMVLLENSGGLPMPTTGTVAVFGVGAYDTVKGGTGSGDVNNRSTVTVRQGLERSGYTVTTSAAYWDAMVAAYTAAGDGHYAQGEVALTADSARPTQPTETAVYVLARNSGEGSDRTATKGDYYLNDTELGNLAMLGRTYRKVVVVLNVGAVVDTTFFRQLNEQAKPGKHSKYGPALDALLLMSQPGQEAGLALVDVLNGAVSPSGKTVDTWASKYDYYPASATFANNDGDSAEEVYSEGIYVGYRYFDSFYRSIARGGPSEVVNYPFGFGLSYTDFEVDTRSVRADADVVTVRARVTNTGRKASGKDVVQVYFSAPTGGLDKPYQELAAYAKTAVLAPGQSQTLTLSFPTSEMSSYDESKAAYVLEKGAYLIRVGDSSRNTSVEAVLKLGRTVTTEQLSTQLDDQKPVNQLTSDPRNFYRYPGETSQIRHAQVIPLRASAITTQNHASPVAQNVSVSPSSDYYPIDGDQISSVTAYLPEGQTDWDGTGAPYQAKEGESAQSVTVSPGATLYDVAKGTVSMTQFVAGLSVEQLQDIVEGGTGGVTPTTSAPNGSAGATTARHEDVGIPSASLVDGPAGVRITQKWTDGGQTYYQYATAWPIGTMLAQMWNEDMIRTVGEAIGAEVKEFGATLWLAPGMNIHRDPLNGRNFEYFSEDPLVSGRTAAGETLSVQETPGIGVTIKHFATNNQETQRMTENNTVGERALREIYLKGFEIAVKEAQPMAIMSSYNRINGTYTAGSYDLLTDIARGEWGYAGFVMSDWSAVRAGVIDGAYAGNDIWMPGPGFLGGYVGEISDALHGVTTPPNIQTTIDVGGLPKYIWASNSFTGGPVYNWVLGPWRLNAGGTVFATTTVDSSAIGAQRLSGRGGFTITSDVTTPDPPFTSVQQAYEWLQKIIARPYDYTLNPRAVAGIEVKITEGSPSAVTKFTVTLRGNKTKMRLGDLQRSAAHILTVLMHTSQFAELAETQGVSGIQIAPYSQQFDNLVQYFTTTRGPVGGGKRR